MLVLAVIVMITAITTSRVQYTLSNTAQRERKLRGNYAANAGIQRAMVELTANPDWEPVGTWGGVLSANSSLGFEVEVVNNRTGSTPRFTPEGLSVPPKRVWLRSKGRSMARF